MDEHVQGTPRLQAVYECLNEIDFVCEAFDEIAAIIGTEQAADTEQDKRKDA